MPRTVNRPKTTLLAALVLCLTAAGVSAQSGDVGYPTPVFSNEIAGRIAPRDIGDARLTRHFYTFRGTEGDLLMTVEAADLTGDVDLFIAQGQRPLLKVTLYGGGSSPTTISKTVYLRKEETLVLRVEARSTGDADGTYRVKLDGAFAPAPTDLAQAAEPSAPSLPDEAGERKGRRTTATGARIYEPPPPEVAAAPEPTPDEATPQPSPDSAEPAREPEAGTDAKPAASEERKTTTATRPSRGGRGTRRRGRGTTPSTPPAEAANDSAAATAPPGERPAGEAAGTEAAAPAKPVRVPRAKTPRGSRRRERPAADSSTEGAAATAGETSAETTAPATRLLIVTRDGETFERDMATVRRVTVENNQVVVVGRDGTVARVPLAKVLRMSIEPLPAP